MAGPKLPVACTGRVSWRALLLHCRKSTYTGQGDFGDAAHFVENLDGKTRRYLRADTDL